MEYDVLLPPLPIWVQSELFADMLWLSFQMTTFFILFTDIKHYQTIKAVTAPDEVAG